jgi:Flp pilus assembly protein TadG
MTRSIKALFGDKRGNVLILTAASLPLILGSIGLAVDSIQLSLLRRHLQRAADSGALAGAYALVQQKNASQAVTRALVFNDAFPLASTPTIQNAPQSGAYAGNPRAVRVLLSAERNLPFMSFFAATRAVHVEATAALVYSGKYCMIALDESSATGITFSGNSTANLGCGVIANSSGAAAVVGAGSAYVVASPVAAVGNVPSSSAYQQPTLLLPYSLKQDDPFIDLPQPAPPPCQAGVNVANQHDTRSITPGCYAGFNVHGTLNLAPGTYYLTGNLTANSQSAINGNGVTLVFTSATPSVQGTYPTLTLNGGAELNLKAPTSGTYEGVLMHYDGRSLGGSHFINGNSTSVFEGAFYFPKQNLTFNGNSSMETNCIQLVASRLTFTGNTEINNTCPTGGGAKSFDAKWVRLVG